MKKTYNKPQTSVVASIFTSPLASSGDNKATATYGGGENGDQHDHTDNIGTAGDGDNIIMESKGNSFSSWDDED